MIWGLAKPWFTVGAHLHLCEGNSFLTFTISTGSYLKKLARVQCSARLIGVGVLSFFGEAFSDWAILAAISLENIRSAAMIYIEVCPGS